jgi:hypothetical protein
VLRESCERIVYNNIIFNLLLKETLMLFDNMNLFEVFATSALLAMVSGAFCVWTISVFEKVGEWMRSRRRLVNVITVDEKGNVHMRK